MKNPKMAQKSRVWQVLSCILLVLSVSIVMPLLAFADGLQTAVLASVPNTGDEIGGFLILIGVLVFLSLLLLIVAIWYSRRKKKKEEKGKHSR